MKRLLLILAALPVVTGCASSGHQSTPARHRPTHSPSPRPSRTPKPTGSPTVIPTGVPTSLPTQGPTGGPIVYPSHCVARDGNQLPDPACTPGALNPAVTQANIHQTVCVSGWTSTVRPPVSYTSVVKGLAITAYGDYAGAAFAGYELDHFIPLSLGGAPWDVRNLWPEHPASVNPKDNVEFAAYKAVCAGTLPLATAQTEIAADWISLGHQLHVPGIPAS